MAAARQGVPPAGGTVSAFRVCGWFGLAAATAIALTACAARDLSRGVQIVLIGAAVAVFLALALATRAITGRDTLIYYHHEIAVLSAVAALAAVLGAPVLGHLDATALGLGAFLVCGRVGCLHSGCCHGLPAAHGVVYGADRAPAAFPRYLVGVRLLPVQAIEAVTVALIVAAALLLVPTTPGKAFAFYVLGYAVLRFGLEELRGDPVRRYWRGLSEAQWTSLLVVGALTAGAWAGLLPGREAHAAVLALLVLAAVAVSRWPRRDLLHPRHVRQLVAALLAARSDVVTTAAGLRLSAGTTAGAEHYTFSRPGRGLGRGDAEAIARVITWVRGPGAPGQLVGGAAGAYHLVFGSATGRRGGEVAGARPLEGHEWSQRRP